MKVQVEGYSGYEGNEKPVRFVLGNRSIGIEEVVDRWHGESATYFRILGNDENFYILKRGIEGEWELVSFTHKDSRGTELKFEGKKELQ